jgi:FMN-dependent NADH-azoreductase
MTNVLYMTLTPRGDAVHARRSAAHVLDEIVRPHPDAQVTVRDLADGLLADTDVDAERSSSERAVVARADALVDELVAADILVIAVPMVGFAIPPTLKAWIDRVTRRGRTFTYEGGKPKGLLGGKRAIIAAPASATYHTPYLRQMLGFLGITDVTAIDVEGIAAGTRPATSAIDIGILWPRDPAARPAVPSHADENAMLGGSTNDVMQSPRHTGAERLHPSPSSRGAPLGAPSSKVRHLRTPWPRGEGL